MSLRRKIAILALALSPTLIPLAPAHAGGCLIGMAAGGYLGHKYHHTIIGMAGGCAAGKILDGMYHRYKEKHPDASMMSFFQEHEDQVKGAFSSAGIAVPVENQQ